MRRTARVCGQISALTLLLCIAAGTAAAQPLGTFSWQLSPFCNVVTVNVVQAGAVYTLDGWDNQCGSGVHAPLVGTATLNPSGTLAIGLAIVTTPGGAPLHVDATLPLPNLNGTWRDSAGNTGVFVFGAPGTGGSPRPLLEGGLITSVLAGPGLSGGGASGGVTLAVDSASVQSRVTGVCPGGQQMTSINQDGTVNCAAGSGGSHAGPSSTAVGLGALVVNTGSSNSAVGVAALTANTIGGNNTAVGAGAMEANTTGSQNVAVGAGALLTNTTGIHNVAVGESALRNATIADRNTAVGQSALNLLTTGVDNTGVGAFAMDANTTGAQNVALGHLALAGNTTGGSNVAVGESALRSATTAANNTAVGRRTLELATGINNTALGAFAMFASTTGTSNVAVGLEALGNTPTASFSTAVGNFSLRTGGFNSTAVGFRALYAGGDDNVAIGADSMLVSTGFQNTAIGTYALNDLTTGDSNIAIGYGAGSSMTSGSNNIHIGNFGQNEDNTTRIGSNQTRAFLAGVSGVNVGAGNAVFVSAQGQLGILPSTRRTKAEIVSLPPAVSGRLHELRPVQFRYKESAGSGDQPLQYGLIAEEVEHVLPQLVAYDSSGEIETVKYHLLPSLLLAEVQRLERERAALQREMTELRALVDSLLRQQR